MAEHNDEPTDGEQAWKISVAVIEKDAELKGMTDKDITMAWKMGLAAYLEARGYGARFPHDPQEARR